MDRANAAHIRNAVIACVAVICVAALVWVMGHPRQDQTPQRSKMVPDNLVTSSGAEVTSSSSAEPTDPYAATANNVAANTYATARERYYGQVRTLYFAADCGVMFSSDPVAGEQNITPLVAALGTALYQQGEANGIFDTSIRDGAQKAASDGQTKAAQSGTCDYWKKHPDEVYALRQQARIAISGLAYLNQ